MAFGINILKSIFLILLIWTVSGFGLNAQLNNGSAASDFSLTDVYNNSYNLYSKMGTNKSAVVEFGVTWCHYCWDFHQSHVMRDIYNNYASETTVIFMEADYATNTECLFGPANCNYLSQGDFVTGMPYTIANLSPTNGSNVIADYNVIYYPLLYTISPDKRVWELKTQTYLEVENWIRYSFKLNATANLTHCFCGFNGKINLNTVGGFGNLKFNWSNGQTSRNLENLAPGSYQVTITDDNGYYKKFGPWIINAPPKMLEISNNKLNHVKCYADNTGSIEIQSRYGVAPYSYSWSNGNSTSKIDQLSAGPYKVTVTDQVGCSVTAFYVINQTTDINFSGTSTTDVCETTSGSIQLYAQGGTPPYKYDIGNGFQNKVLFPNLNGGKDYQIQLLDANNCRDSIKLYVPLTRKPTLKIFGDSVLNCKVKQTQLMGKVISNSLKYNWKHSTDSTFYSKDSIITVTNSGQYYLTIKDTITGCSNLDSFHVMVDQTVPTISIHQPDTLSCIKPQINLDASASSNGPNFSYLWSTSTGQINGSPNSPVVNVTKAGTYLFYIENILNFCNNIDSIELQEKTKPTADFLVSIADQEIKLNNLSIGLPEKFYWDFGDGQQSNEANPKHKYQNYGGYKICLNIENECGTDSKCISIFISKPGVLKIATSEVVHVACFGEASGSIQIKAEGGQPPYKFQWSNQDTTSSIYNLRSGNYIVSITDQQNFIIEKEFIILQPGELLLDQIDLTPASSGQANGRIYLNNSGGVKPYQYVWSNGMTTNPIEMLKSGSYQVQLTDANLCMKEFGPFEIKELTSINENQKIPVIKLRTDPVNRLIYLNIESEMLENFTISISDVFGNGFLSKKLSGKHFHEILESQNLNSGVYFLTVQFANKQKLIKFLWY